MTVDRGIGHEYVDPLERPLSYDELHPNGHDADEMDTALASTNAHEPETGPPVLPDDFWTSRPVLTHIRNAVQARSAAPDAVLGGVLAGVALRTPPEIVLPPIVGGHGSLNLLVGIIGVSGAGKGIAMRTSDDLLPVRPSWAGIGPPGTGQGMADVFFETIKGENGQPEHRRCREAFQFEVDEGQVLTKLSEGTGSITLETMRMSFNGERIGTTTVSAPWRQLARSSYRMTWLLGFQPAIVRPLLADTPGGTPQRFLWVGTVDPDAPLRPVEHPGKLSLSEPGTEPGKLMPMRVAPSISDEVWRRRHEVLTGQREPGAYESQRDLLRLKVAALLGLLVGRVTVTIEDWALAEVMLDTSDAVREATLRHNRAADAREEMGRNLRHANRARAEEDARQGVQADIRRVARVIQRKALPAPEEVSRRDLRNAVASRDREWFEPALNYAEAEGWLIGTDHGTYTSRDG